MISIEVTHGSTSVGHQKNDSSPSPQEDWSTPITTFSMSTSTVQPTSAQQQDPLHRNTVDNAGNNAADFDEPRDEDQTAEAPDNNILIRPK